MVANPSFYLFAVAGQLRVAHRFGHIRQKARRRRGTGSAGAAGTRRLIVMMRASPTSRIEVGEEARGFGCTSADG